MVRRYDLLCLPFTELSLGPGVRESCPLTFFECCHHAVMIRNLV
jgi:hypothetical protein